MIRPAEPGELQRIQDIEVAAGQLFHAIGMDPVADAPPMTKEELAAYQRVGRAWVTTESYGVAVAYILVDVLGVWAHIEQVTVHPDQGRCGVGSTLIAHVERWAPQGQTSGDSR